jgi:hypothetical protein
MPGNVFFYGAKKSKETMRRSTSIVGDCSDQQNQALWKIVVASSVVSMLFRQPAGFYGEPASSRLSISVFSIRALHRSYATIRLCEIVRGRPREMPIGVGQ